MEQINIRSLQHFLYCPHRWGLIEIDQAWAENHFITRAQITHNRVDSGKIYSSRGKKVFTSVRIWNDEYGLTGIADCIEEKNGLFTIVEYKPTAPKNELYHKEDAIQVFAQKICVDQILNCDCNAILYYSDSHKRIKLPFDKEFDYYRDQLIDTLLQIRKLMRNGTVPPIPDKQKCNGCSFQDICLPKAYKNKSVLRDTISFLLGGDE